jgi:hypothetical protein
MLVAMLSGDWTAIDRAVDLIGSERELIVEGQVDVPSTAHEALLERVVPQGINPKIVLLDLVIEPSGIGAAVITRRQVELRERLIEEGQFTQVAIHSGEDTVATIDVSTAHS